MGVNKFFFSSTFELRNFFLPHDLVISFKEQKRNVCEIGKIFISYFYTTDAIFDFPQKLFSLFE